MQRPKHQRGWFVTNINTGMKGKVEDVFMGTNGWEYTIVVGGARLTFPESVLIRQGNQENIFKQSKKGGY